MPTDFLYHEKSGTAFEFGDTTILRSHIDNPSNLEHEFLHSVINPIVEKLSKQLTDNQKQRIINLASFRLKVEEDYGNHYESLLCEEIIRTYGENIKDPRKPLSYDDFVSIVNGISEEEFKEELSNNENLKKGCAMLEITNAKGLRERSREYYEQFVSGGELRNIVYAFYQKYIQEKARNSKINFEEFVLEKFHKEF